MDINNFYSCFNHILYNHNCSEEFYKDFNTYMANRFLSMRSKEDCFLVNEFSNSYMYLYDFGDYMSWIKFFKIFCLKISYKKINYIKKNKVGKAVKNESEKLIEILSKNLEISKRECKLILDKLPKEEINNLKKLL